MNLEMSYVYSKKSIKEVVDFFTQYLDASYISHGEIQSGRAIDFNTWSPKLAQVLGYEFGLARADATDLDKYDGTTYHVAVAWLGDKIVSAAYISIFREGPKFAVLEDILTHPDYRSVGYGRQLYEWIEQGLGHEGVEKIFLESGMKNKDAHSFLKGLGFETCSLVMEKDLE